MQQEVTAAEARVELRARYDVAAAATELLLLSHAARDRDPNQLQGVTTREAAACVARSQLPLELYDARAQLAQLMRRGLAQQLAAAADERGGEVVDEAARRLPPRVRADGRVRAEL